MIINKICLIFQFYVLKYINLLHLFKKKSYFEVLFLLFSNYNAKFIFKKDVITLSKTENYISISTRT